MPAPLMYLGCRYALGLSLVILSSFGKISKSFVDDDGEYAGIDEEDDDEWAFVIQFAVAIMMGPNWNSALHV